jgi:hypothetical protein
MKSLLTTCLLAILLYACKSERKVESLYDVLQSIAPPRQEYTIDPAKDNIITGEKGTKLFLPANLFVYKDGSLPTGKVKVVLEEFFSIAEFASNGLSTMSDSLLLETGGMLNIKVTAEGKKLVVSADKSYVVAFPNKKVERMDLFYGDRTAGKINWVFDPVNSPNAETRDPFFDNDTTLFEKKLHLIRMTSQGGGGNFNWQTRSNVYLFHWMDSCLDLTPKSIITDVYVNDTIFYTVKFRFTRAGKAVDLKFENVPAKIQPILKNSILSMPAVIMNPFSDEELIHYEFSCEFGIGRRYILDKYEEKFNAKYKQYRDKAIQKMNGIELDGYVFTVNRFGWINCDRFLDDSTQKTELWVKSIDEGESKVMAVFEDMNSVMQGQKGANGYSFPNIPIGRPIRLIAIGYKNGKPLLSTKNIKVGKVAIAMDGFREFSLKELETELNTTPR